MCVRSNLKSFGYENYELVAYLGFEINGTIRENNRKINSKRKLYKELTVQRKWVNVSKIQTCLIFIIF